MLKTKKNQVINDICSFNALLGEKDPSYTTDNLNYYQRVSYCKISKKINAKQLNIELKNKKTKKQLTLDIKLKKKIKFVYYPMLPFIPLTMVE